MKKILKKLHLFWLKYFPTKIDKLNSKLEKAVKEQEIERSILKLKINKYVKKHYGFKVSEYIPPKGSNTAKVYVAVNKTFGEEMKTLSLILLPNLTWAK